MWHPSCRYFSACYFVMNDIKHGAITDGHQFQWCWYSNYFVWEHPHFESWQESLLHVLIQDGWHLVSLSCLSWTFQHSLWTWTLLTHPSPYAANILWCISDHWQTRIGMIEYSFFLYICNVLVILVWTILDLQLSDGGTIWLLTSLTLMLIVGTTKGFPSVL